MNYRHAYHAGNAADCLKHAVLVWVLRALARKDKPFFVLDTHAGAGRYDLDDLPARRTSEASRGILRLLGEPHPALADYVAVCSPARGRPGALPLDPAGAGRPQTPGRWYLGSPSIIQALLRASDRGVACELQPEDASTLRRAMGRDSRVAVHLRDGYAAIKAFLPPPERRGLTLIDPPYESPDEYELVLEAVCTAQTRFPGGTVLAWYPVKHRAPVRALHDALRQAGVPDVMAAELLLREPLDPARLNGSGLLVVNPPYRFEAEVPAILAALLERLGDRETGEGTSLIRLTDER